MLPAKKTAKKASVKKKLPAKKKDGDVKGKKGRKGEDLMCFLTTACMQHRGLADDCRELNTLRRYRDEYLMQSADSRILVSEYYAVAPLIVEKIGNSIEATRVYAYIYSCVTKACEQIDGSRLEAARTTYVNMVKKLCRDFKVQARFF